MRAFVIAVVLLACGSAPWGAKRTGAQGVDSTCLVPWQNSPLKPQNVVWINPDSVMVDMCQGPQYLEEFGKGPFLVIFLYYIIPDSLPIGGGTIIRDWMDIDSSFRGVRAGLHSIEQEFGHFTMVLGGTGPLVDTSQAKQWYLSFDNYLNIDTADWYLQQVPGVNINVVEGAEFAGYPRFYEGIQPADTQQDVRVWPEPCSSLLHLSLRLGQDEIVFYDALGEQFKVTAKQENQESSICDVSKVPSGVYYFHFHDQFFKILIQR